jgi:hypothetical protein
LAGFRIEEHFAEAIINEDQTAVGDSELCKTQRLRSEVEGDQARGSGHGVKALKSHSQNAKPNFNIETQKTRRI